MREAFRLEVKSVLQLGLETVKIIFADFFEIKSRRLHFNKHFLTAAQSFFVVVSIELDYFTGYEPSFLESIVI